MAQKSGLRMVRKKSRSDERHEDSVNQHLFVRRYDGKRRRRNPNERDCMARAFQFNLQRIIENTIVRESNLPDLMISNGYLTEEECCYIRERPNRKDQIRTLMVIIRGRSLKNMECLLKYFEQENEDLARDIHNCYEDLMNQGYRDKECLRCKLKTHVDVKSVADCLFTLDVISGKLYNETVMTEAAMGGQDKLWGKLIADLESNICPKKAFNCLKSCLSEKGHYEHLADEMENFLIDGCKMSECICNVELRSQVVSWSDCATLYSTEPISTETSGSAFSVELRSRLLENASPRPPAMNFTSGCWSGESTIDSSGDVELRQDRARRHTRPMAMYILPQVEEKFRNNRVNEPVDDISNNLTCA